MEANELLGEALRRNRIHGNTPKSGRLIREIYIDGHIKSFEDALHLIGFLVDIATTTQPNQDRE